MPLHVLSPREVQAAGSGDHADGGGLFLRVKESNANWLLRYTSPSGRRRDMGLGYECALENSCSPIDLYITIQ
jgi:hypothetical protein